MPLLELQAWYEKLYWPFFEGVCKRRNTVRYFRECEQSQWKSREEIEAGQLAALNALLAHAWANCPFYRNLLDAAGLGARPLQSLEEIVRLPILDKEIIRNNRPGMIAKEQEDQLWKKTTGGSTGETLEFFQTKLSYEWRMAMARRGYAWAGARPGTKQAYIWGAPIGDKRWLRNLKIRLNHFVDRQRYYNSFLFDNAAIAACIRSMNRYRPEFVVGYVNPLYNLALFSRQGHPIAFRPRAVLTAAEKLHAFQKQTLQEVFGCEVFETYGSREFMLIASECAEHDGLHVSAENLLVEIVDAKGLPVRDGEVGRVVVTDLHNYGMPFIRYEVGDLAVPRSRPCPCGRGLPLIEKIVGRTLDMLRTADGRQVPGEFFVYLLLDFCDIKQFQVVQDALEHVEFRYVPQRDLKSDTVERVRRKMELVFGPTVTIDMVRLDEIPLTAAGKRQVAIANLDSLSG
jgi:phenylacetate-CoA ligase